MTEYVMIDRELVRQAAFAAFNCRDEKLFDALIAVFEAPQQAAEPVVITLGKGDKLVADIFAHNSDGIVHKAGVGIFDPDPGTVYGVGVKDTRIDGLSITSDRRPLVLIWSDKHESLQVIVDELQESIAHLAGHPPAQRFQQIGFTRQDHIGKPSSTIIADTVYRAASDAGVYVPVFVGEAQAHAVDGAVIREAIRTMDDSERLDIFSEYCRCCGSNDPTCQCWNDE